MEILRIIEVAERLIESQGLERSKLAKKLGFSTRYIADIKAGKSKNPGSDFILSLINNLNFNPIWLESGEGEPFNNHRTGISVERVSPTQASLIEESCKIPLLRQKVSCGSGMDWESEQNIQGFIDLRAVIPRLAIKKLIALCVKGTSMLGAGIKDGDYVFFDADAEQSLEDDIYVFALDGDVYCKRLEFDGISRKVKIYSIRVADLEKAELLAAIDMNDIAATERLTIFGRVLYWVHTNREHD